MVCKSTSFSDMFLQKHIGFTVTCTYADTFRVIGKVNHTILDSLEVTCLVVMIVEHSIFPVSSAGSTKTSRAFVGLKLASIVSIFDEELHMLGYVTVDNDWSIVLQVKLKVVEVLDGKS